MGGASAEDAAAPRRVDAPATEAMAPRSRRREDRCSGSFEDITRILVFIQRMKACCIRAQGELSSKGMFCHPQQPRGEKLGRPSASGEAHRMLSSWTGLLRDSGCLACSEITVDGLLPVLSCGFVAFGQGDHMLIAIRCKRGARVHHLDVGGRFIERIESDINRGDQQIGKKVDVLKVPCSNIEGSSDPHCIQWSVFYGEG